MKFYIFLITLCVLSIYGIGEENKRFECPDEILEEMVSIQTLAFAPRIVDETYVPSGRVIAPCFERNILMEAPFAFFPAREYPAYQIPVDEFLADSHLVTNREYEKFVIDTDSPTPSHWIDGEIPTWAEELPVVNISYEEAQAYAHWAGKRLMTEEEWQRIIEQEEGENKWHDATLIGAVDQPLIGEWTSSDFTVVSEQAPLFPEYWNKKAQAPEEVFKVVRKKGTAGMAYRMPMHQHACNAQTGFRCIFSDDEG